MNKVLIFDTTLRDGSQGEGINYSLMDKVRIAEKLDELGVHYIEGGWPGSNPKDGLFFARMARRRFKNAQITAFGSTRRSGISAARDRNLRAIVASGVKTAAIFGKTWLLHVKNVLHSTPEENLAMIRDSVGFLVKKGLTVFYDAEHFFDGYRDEPAYAVRCLKAAEEAGASFLVLCDTNGGMLPSQVSAIVSEVRKHVRTPLGIHCHNDSATAVANSIAAVEAGCTMVQGTINGYGERCGNANLCSIIPNLELKLGMKVLPNGSLNKLYDLAHYVSEVANLSPDEHLAYVGQAAFAHKGGI
ncbi:MAG: citramalate synthase, partial [Deltaproteobacteria bacterium]